MMLLQFRYANRQKYTYIGNTVFFRKSLFDAHPQDPDYTPLPEDRPGGFNWGERPQNQQ